MSIDRFPEWERGEGDPSAAEYNPIPYEENHAAHEAERAFYLRKAHEYGWLHTTLIPLNSAAPAPVTPEDGELIRAAAQGAGLERWLHAVVSDHRAKKSKTKGGAK